MFFGALASITHIAKILALYLLLWPAKKGKARNPMQFMAFQFLLLFLMLLPYQDPNASKAMNRFLLVVTVLQYCSWVGLAYLIWSAS